MEPRRLLHPLPVFLIVIFVAVAVGDIVQELSEEPLPPPKALGSRVPRFQAREPVVDFRPGRADRAIELLHFPELAPGQWSAPERRGIWARGRAAELTIDLEVGGHRVLVLEGLRAGGKRPAQALRVTINGVECGSVDVEPGWRRYVFELPDGAVRGGSNRVVFEFPDRTEAGVTRRALLVRRFGLFFDTASDAEVLDGTRPVVVDVDAERVTIRRSGYFELPLTLDDRTDALQMRFRFPSDKGRAQMVVAKRRERADGTDEIVRLALDAVQKSSGRVRIPLHGRRGDFLFRIDADLDSADDLLLIWSLRLVEEGDPSRRPLARNSSPS